MIKGFISVLSFSVAWYILFTPTPASAEEIQEDVIVEEIQEDVIVEESAPKPVTDEPGVWSVVDEGGNVVNAIISTESQCGNDGNWGGRLPTNSPCPGCQLVFQQPGQAGLLSSPGTQVQYHSENNTHSVTTDVHSDGGVVGTRTEVYPQGGGAPVEQSAKLRFTDNDQSADVSLSEGFVDSSENYIRVEISSIEEKSIFEYEGVYELENNLEQDVEVALDGQQEDAGFVESILRLASNVSSFLRNLFGLGA